VDDCCCYCWFSITIQSKLIHQLYCCYIMGLHSVLGFTTSSLLSFLLDPFCWCWCFGPVGGAGASTVGGVGAGTVGASFSEKFLSIFLRLFLCQKLFFASTNGYSRKFVYELKYVYGKGHNQKDIMVLKFLRDVFHNFFLRNICQHFFWD